jgi:hypothetical protein
MNPAIGARLAALEAQAAYQRPTARRHRAVDDPEALLQAYRALVDAPSDRGHVTALDGVSPCEMVEQFRRIIGRRNRP